MKFTKEEVELAENIVNSFTHSFLNIEDITENFKDLGFLVNRNKMIGYTSHMEYDEKEGRGNISYSVEENSRRQQEILLLNFSYFITRSDKNIKIYYKDIPRKNAMKRFSSLLVNTSADKEFGIYEEDLKQGGIRK